MDYSQLSLIYAHCFKKKVRKNTRDRKDIEVQNIHLLMAVF